MRVVKIPVTNYDVIKYSHMNHNATVIVMKAIEEQVRIKYGEHAEIVSCEEELSYLTRSLNNSGCFVATVNIIEKDAQTDAMMYMIENSSTSYSESKYSREVLTRLIIKKT